MTLTCLGSNSRGNCYILHSDTEALVIECGVSFMEVKKALQFNISKISAAIVSHEHNDHARYISEYVRYGVLVMASEHVLKAKGVQQSPFVKSIEPSKGYKVGGFKVFAFSVQHDVPCLGFLVDHSEMGRLLFLTDTMYCEYTFQGLNHILIECNYSNQILDRNIRSGAMEASMRKRLMETHMELGTTKGILQANNLSKVSTIVLLHLSDGNSNEQQFVDEVQGATGNVVHAANRGLELELVKID